MNVWPKCAEWNQGLWNIFYLVQILVFKALRNLESSTVLSLMIFMKFVCVLANLFLVFFISTIELYIRTRGCTGDAACTNATGPQDDKCAIPYAR